MSAYLIVRAKVADPQVRVEFDRWYEREHLPEAIEVFAARRAWRGWSDTDPEIHYAFYEFADVAAASAVAESAGIGELIAEFDRLWSGRVTRTREIVACQQVLDAAG